MNTTALDSLIRDKLTEGIESDIRSSDSSSANRTDIQSVQLDDGHGLDTGASSTSVGSVPLSAVSMYFQTNPQLPVELKRAAERAATQARKEAERNAYAEANGGAVKYSWWKDPDVWLKIGMVAIDTYNRVEVQRNLQRAAASSAPQMGAAHGLLPQSHPTPVAPKPPIRHVVISGCSAKDSPGGGSPAPADLAAAGPSAQVARYNLGDLLCFEVTSLQPALLIPPSR